MPTEYTEDEPCITPEQAMGWTERLIWIAAAVLFVAVVGMPLWFGTLQFSDFFSLGRSLWVGRTGS